ncbi:hypothetical protein NMY22_g317 [Coprinellus aureogranulatus]|nr:hypothetical protein NMY22_g317 [Coprinellus aureogranulatus]
MANHPSPGPFVHTHQARYASTPQQRPPGTPSNASINGGGWAMGPPQLQPVSRSATPATGMETMNNMQGPHLHQPMASFNSFSSPPTPPIGSGFAVTPPSANTAPGSVTTPPSANATPPRPLVISADFRNRTQRTFGLSQESQNVMRGLESIANSIPGTSHKPFSVMMYYNMGAMLKLTDVIQSRFALMPNAQEFRNAFERILEALDQDTGFVLKDSHTRIIRGVANNMSFDKSLFQMDQMARRVQSYLYAHRQDLGLTEAFASPVNQAIFFRGVRRTTSSVQGAFRADLKASVDVKNNTQTSLVKYVKTIHQKYTVGAAEAVTITKGHIIRLACMRAFLFDRQDVMYPATAQKVVPAKRPAPQGEDSDEEDDDGLDEGEDDSDIRHITSWEGDLVPEPAMPARRHFWPMWDWWMECRRIEFGNEMNSDAWKSYYRRILAADIARIPHALSEPCPAASQALYHAQVYCGGILSTSGQDANDNGGLGAPGYSGAANGLEFAANAPIVDFNDYNWDDAWVLTGASSARRPLPKSLRYETCKHSALPFARKLISFLPDSRTTTGKAWTEDYIVKGSGSCFAVPYHKLTPNAVAVVGYEPTTVFSDNFNVTHSFWFHKFIPRPQPGTSCEPRVLNVGDSLLTNASIYEWKIVAIARPSAEKSSFAYHGMTLDSCDVEGFDFKLGVEPHTRPIMEVTAYASCMDIGATVAIETHFTTSLPPRRLARYRHYSIQYTAAGSLSEYLTNMARLAERDIMSRAQVFVAKNRTDRFALSLDAKSEFCPVVVGTNSKEPLPCAVEPPHIKCRDLFGTPNLDAFVRPILNLLHFYLASLRIDFGNPSSNNLLTNPEVLNRTLSPDLEDPYALLTPSAPSLLYAYMNEQSLLSRSGSESAFNASQIPGPSILRKGYTCGSLKRKDAANLIVSVFVATSGMFTTGWAVFIFIAKCLHPKPEPEDQLVEECRCGLRQDLRCRGRRDLEAQGRSKTL